MNYSTTISPAAVYGITAARAAYNAAQPATVREGEADLPNPGLLAHDSDYLDFVLKNAVESWCRQYAPVVVPEVPPVEVNGVPQTVSFRQAKNQLQLVGIWDSAIAAAEAIADPTTRIKIVGLLLDSAEYERQRPELVGFAKSALGLTDAQLDALFIAAALL